jgi:hypothetical protein
MNTTSVGLGFLESNIPIMRFLMGAEMVAPTGELVRNP